MLPITTIIYVFLEEEVTKIFLEAIYVNNHCTLGYPPTKYEPQFLLEKNDIFFVGEIYIVKLLKIGVLIYL